MKKNFLFAMLAISLAGAGFGGISMAAEEKCSEDTYEITVTNVEGTTYLCTSTAKKLTSNNLKTCNGGTYFLGNSLNSASDYSIPITTSYTFSEGSSITCNKEMAAKIGDTLYKSFDSAVNAAGTDDVIVLLNSGYTYTMISAEQVIKVRKNGLSLKIKAPDGQYVVKNSTSEGITTFNVVDADVEFTDVNGVGSYQSFSASMFSKDGTYKLLKDITTTLRIAPGILASNVTVDLNGHTLTSTASDYAVFLSRGGSDTKRKIFSFIDNSENKGGKLVVNPDAKAAIQGQGKFNDIIIGEGVIVDGGAVTVLKENMTLTVNGSINGGNGFAIATNGSSTKTPNITINEGASLSSNNTTAIYFPSEGTLNIKGGTISGSYGIVACGGTIKISEKAIINATGEGSATVGDNPILLKKGSKVIMNIAANYPGSATFKVENDLGETIIVAGNQQEYQDYTVKFGADETEKTIELTKDGTSAKITEPTNPADKEDGSKFDGWYNGTETTAFNFDTAVSSDVELVSKWYKEISTIELTGIVTPVSGDAPSIDGISTTTTGITLTTKQWQDNSNNQNVAMNEGDKFAKGNPYTLYIEFSVDEGYKLADEVSCSNSCTVTTENTNSLRLTYTAEAKKYTVTWDIEGQKTTTEVEEGSTPTYTGTPTKAADNSYTYSFSGWSLDGKNVVDLSSQQITSDVTYTAIFTATKKTTSTGGGGGGGGGSSSSYSCKNLPENAVANNTKKPSSRTDYFYDTDTSKVCSFVCKEGYEWNKSASKCEVVTTTTTGDNTKIDEQKPEENKNDTTANPQETLSDGLTTELHDAYDFAHKYEITTMPSAAEANMYSQLNRIAMAKMLSQYAINVLGKTPDTSKVVPTFSDVTPELNQEYSDAVTLAYQLEIMGINIEEFRPFDPVIRAEFATALSRLLFATPDGEYEGTAQYYVNHLAKLVEEKIITNNDPLLNELRGYVMIMLMRSAQ